MNLINEQIYNEVHYGESGIRNIIKEEIDDEFIEEMVTKLDDWRLSYNIDLEPNIPDSKIVCTSIAEAVLIFDVFTIQQMIGILIPKFNMPLIDSINTITEIIELLDDTIYELARHGHVITIESKYKLDSKLKTILETRHYLPPMVCEPRDWVSNNEGGWLTINQSVIHGSLNHHNQYVDLETLNILQKIAFEIDKDILAVEEVPNKQLDTYEKKIQFEEFKRVSKKVYEEFKKYKKLYFVWRYDKRGRMYSQGYHINLQSTSYKKALLNFSKKELITGEL